jgi:hypothetical protein
MNRREFFAERATYGAIRAAVRGRLYSKATRACRKVARMTGALAILVVFAIVAAFTWWMD